MPKIYEYFGFIFRAYHAERGVLDHINIREKHGVPPLASKGKCTAEAFIRKYSKNIIDKWVWFFVMNQQVRSTNIKTKL